MDVSFARAAAGVGDGFAAGFTPAGDAPEPTTGSRCVACPVRDRCIGNIAAQAGTAQLHHVLAGRRLLRIGQALYRADDPFRHVHVVRSGALKSIAPAESDRIVGLHVAGELVGGDGLAGGRHRVSVRALEDTELCAIRFLPSVGAQHAGTRVFYERVWDMLSCELLRERAHRSLLATLPPAQRARAFLASLAQRLQVRSSMPAELRVALWSPDIASYLGVDVATVLAMLQPGLPSSRGRVNTFQ